MITTYFFDVVLFLYEVLFPGQEHASKSTLLPFFTTTFLFQTLFSSKTCIYRWFCAGL